MLIYKNLSPQIIKDFYLLGRGELFQAFIDTAQHMLKTPPTAVTEHGECCLFTYKLSSLWYSRQMVSYVQYRRAPHLIL